MPSIVRSIIVGITLALGASTSMGAGQMIEISPAMNSYPVGLLNRVRTCSAIDDIFRQNRHPIDHVEAWFKEFQRSVYSSILGEIRKPVNDQYITTLNDAHTSVQDIRRLVDYRTEQALITMLDATVRKYGDGQKCEEASSVILLRIAEQRDRAWAWAEAMDRYLKNGEKRWGMYLHTKSTDKSFGEYERHRDGFKAYMR